MPKGIEFDLPTADDLFTTQEQRDNKNKEQIENIPIDLIDDFPNHPFKVRYDTDMLKLIDSIKENGVLIPTILRPKDNGRYEMVAGHRRKVGSKDNNKPTVPAIVRNLTDDESIIIMVDSNLQREKILPSERAFSYKLKLEAMKRQGKRIDLTSAPVEQKLGKTSREQLANEVGESPEQVRRYIRLTGLVPEILQMVDDEEIAFRPAVELSYLTQEEQKSLYQTMEIDEITPSLSQAMKLKEFSQSGRLNDDVILSIMSEVKPNQKETFKISKDKISKYIPEDTPKEKFEEIIIEALELYKKKRERDYSR